MQVRPGGAPEAARLRLDGAPGAGRLPGACTASVWSGLCLGRSSGPRGETGMQGESESWVPPGMGPALIHRQKHCVCVLFPSARNAPPPLAEALEGAVCDSNPSSHHSRLLLWAWCFPLSAHLSFLICKYLSKNPAGLWRTWQCPPPRGSPPSVSTAQVVFPFWEGVSSLLAHNSPSRTGGCPPDKELPGGGPGPWLLLCPQAKLVASCLWAAPRDVNSGESTTVAQDTVPWYPSFCGQGPRTPLSGCGALALTGRETQ